MLALGESRRGAARFVKRNSLNSCPFANNVIPDSGGPNKGTFIPTTAAAAAATVRSCARENGMECVEGHRLRGGDGNAIASDVAL